MNHTRMCALMTLSLTDRLSCALFSFSIWFVRQAMLCSPWSCVFILFVFLTSLDFPVPHECLLLTSVRCPIWGRDCLQMKDQFWKYFRDGPVHTWIVYLEVTPGFDIKCLASSLKFSVTYSLSVLKFLFLGSNVFYLIWQILTLFHH